MCHKWNQTKHVSLCGRKCTLNFVRKAVSPLNVSGYVLSNPAILKELTIFGVLVSPPELDSADMQLWGRKPDQLSRVWSGKPHEVWYQCKSQQRPYLSVQLNQVKLFLDKFIHELRILYKNCYTPHVRCATKCVFLAKTTFNFHYISRMCWT